MLNSASVGSALLVFGVLGPLAVWLTRRQDRTRLDAWWAMLTAASVAGVVAITLLDRVPAGSGPDVAVRGCEEGSSLGTINFEAVGNWLLLAPTAFFLVLAVRHVMPGLLVATFGTLAIEGTQTLTELGSCQTADLVRNSTGGVVAGLAAWALLLLSRRRARAPRPQQEQSTPGT